MDGVGHAFGMWAVVWRARWRGVLGLVDEEVVEEEAEVDAVLLEKLLALDVRDLDGVIDRTGLHV